MTDIETVRALFAAQPKAMIERALDRCVDLVPTTDEQLHRYIQAYYGYRIATRAVCPGHVAPFTGVADLFFMRNPEFDQIWVGGRGVGKTLNLSIAEHLLLRFFADTIANIGAVEAQAKKFYTYLERHSMLPRFRKDLVQRPLISETAFRNGGFLEIMPATINRVNSPHPRVACWDEVDLCSAAALAEGSSMPIRTNGRPPQTIYTSSLKFAYGPMVKLMDEATERNRKIYTFCVFEVIETCPVERHRDGAGCVTCPLAKECLDEHVDGAGRTALLPGPGKAARADGFMPIVDVIRMYQSLDSDTWDSQWRCKRPSRKGLVYPQFSDGIHRIDYMGKGDPIVGKFNPALPVFAGVDFGFANATAVIYVQLTSDGRLVAFAEDYATHRISEDTAAAIKAAPWFDRLGWIVGDPAALDARKTLQRHGVRITPADNTKDPGKDGSGISKIRWALAPNGGLPPVLYIDQRCTNLLREIRSYHNPEPHQDKNTDEGPVKSDDHAVDALRYCVAKIIKRTG